MLNENQVIDAVCNYLIQNNYKICQRCNTNEKGIDIIAQKEKTFLYVEAKGGTSSKPGSQRSGLHFNKSQALNHAGKALYQIAEIISSEQGNEFEVGIAFPNDEVHLRVLKQIRFFLKSSCIKTFLVNEDLSIDFL